MPCTMELRTILINCDPIRAYIFGADFVRELYGPMNLNLGLLRSKQMRAHSSVISSSDTRSVSSFRSRKSPQINIVKTSIMSTSNVARNKIRNLVKMASIELDLKAMEVKNTPGMIPTTHVSKLELSSQWLDALKEENDEENSDTSCAESLITN